MLAKELNPIFKYGLLAIPGTILLILPTFSDPINLPKLFVLIPITLTALTLFLFFRRLFAGIEKSRERRTITGLYLLLAALMAIAGFSSNENLIRTIFGTTGRNNGLLYFLLAITLCLLLLRIEIRTREIDYFYSVFRWTSLVFASYCAIQFFSLDPMNWVNPYNRIIGTLGNPNFASSMLAISSVFWLFCAFQSRLSKNNLWPALVLSVSIGFLSWSTDSIQGLVIIALGFALTAYVFLREKVKSRLLPQIFFGGGGVALISLFVSFAGLGPLGQMLGQYTLTLRGWYAYFGIKGMLESPFFGVGVDNYNIAFRLYRTKEFMTQYGVGLSTNNAHSAPSQIGATFGVAVFLLYCILHLWILFEALKVINSRGGYSNSVKGLAILWILVFSQSLLSIEIIGLGILNWILGAILLNLTTTSPGSDASPSSVPSDKSKRKVKELPALVGPITILSLLIGSLPTFAITKEDKSFRMMASIQVQGPQDREWLKEQLGNLSSFTLQQPDKVAQVINNLYRAEMYSEIETILKDLQDRNKNDVYANDMLATYYNITNQVDPELAIRVKLREFDPVNYQLELNLARCFSAKESLDELQKSVERIRDLAPNSPEYVEAETLLNSLKAKLSNP